MKRLTLVIGLLLAVVATAHLTAAASCVRSSDFNPSLGSASISFPDTIGAADGFSPTITVHLKPTSDVSDVKVASVSITGLANGMSVQMISAKTGADTYELHPVFHLPASFDLTKLAGLQLTVQAHVTYTASGTMHAQTICLGKVGTKVPGSVSAFVNGAQTFLGSLSSASNVFDVIRALIKTTEAFDTAQCSRAVDEYTHANTTFTQSCLPYKKALEAVVSDSSVAPADACAQYYKNDKAACTTALTTGPNACVKLYGTLLDLEQNASDVCYRNSCPPVYNLSVHTTAYHDPLYGQSRCVGTDLSNPACRSEFQRVEGPRCPLVNVTKLQSSAETLSPLMSVVQTVCPATKPSGGVPVLKDPKASVLSAAECECLPALDGYVGQAQKLYEFAQQCLIGGSNASNCSSTSYESICDMAVGSALQCGGLGYAEFSASARVYTTPKGSILDFSQDHIAQTTKAIENGGVVVTQAAAKGTVAVDTGQLANAICKTALGDPNVDWSNILNYQSPIGNGNVKTIGKLCAANEKLTSPCICDLSAVSTGTAQTCGGSSLKNECVYDVQQRTATCEPYSPSSSGAPPAGIPNAPTSNDLVRYVTSLAPGTYGQEAGISSCSSPSQGTVVVLQDEGSTTLRATLHSGPIAAPSNSGSSDGYTAYRVYSCTSTGALKIEITIVDSGVTGLHPQTTTPTPSPNPAPQPTTTPATAQQRTN